MSTPAYLTLMTLIVAFCILAWIGAALVIS